MHLRTPYIRKFLRNCFKMTICFLNIYSVLTVFPELSLWAVPSTQINGHSPRRGIQGRKHFTVSQAKLQWKGWSQSIRHPVCLKAVCIYFEYAWEGSEEFTRESCSQMCIWQSPLWQGHGERAASVGVWQVLPRSDRCLRYVWGSDRLTGDKGRRAV